MVEHVGFYLKIVVRVVLRVSVGLGIIYLVEENLNFEEKGNISYDLQGGSKVVLEISNAVVKVAKLMRMALPTVNVLVFVVPKVG